MLIRSVASAVGRRADGAANLGGRSHQWQITGNSSVSPSTAQLTAPPRVPTATYTVKRMRHPELYGGKSNVRFLSECSNAAFKLAVSQIRLQWLEPPSFIPSLHVKQVTIPSDEVRVHMIKTKKRIDNKAVIRTKASRRVMEALKWAIRRCGLGKGLTVRDGAFLIVIPTRDAVEMPMPDLISCAITGLRKVSQHAGKRKLLLPLSSSALGRDFRTHSIGKLLGPSFRKLSLQNTRRNFTTSAWTANISEQLSSSSYVLLSALPDTFLTDDVVRLTQKAQGPTPHALGSAQMAAMPRPPIRYVLDIHPIYAPLTLRQTGSFVLETAKEANAAKVAEHLNGRAIAGRIVRARAIRSREARHLLSSSLTLCSSKAYSPMLFPSVMDFVRSIVRQSPGKVALVRGLPAGITASMLYRRLAARYALAGTGKRQSRMGVFDRQAGAWTSVQVEPIIKLVAEPGAAKYAQNGDMSDVPWRRARKSLSDLTSDGSRSATGCDESQGNLRASNNVDPGATSMFLIKFRSEADAYRLHRRLNGQRWGLTPKSVIFSGHSLDLDTSKESMKTRAESDTNAVFLQATEDDSEFEEGDSLMQEEQITDGVSAGDFSIQTSSSSTQSTWTQRSRPRDGELVSFKRLYIVEVQVFH